MLALCSSLDAAISSIDAANVSVPLASDSSCSVIFTTSWLVVVAVSSIDAVHNSASATACSMSAKESEAFEVARRTSAAVATARFVDSREASMPSSTPCTIASVRSAASVDMAARRRTSEATTANPAPCVPARAASIAALSASSFDWRASFRTSVTKVRISSLALLSAAIAASLSRTSAASPRSESSVASRPARFSTASARSVELRVTPSLAPSSSAAASPRSVPAESARRVIDSAMVVDCPERSLAVLAISPAVAAISSDPAVISDDMALVSRAETAIAWASRRSSSTIALTARLRRPSSSSVVTRLTSTEKSPAATASAASASSRAGVERRRSRKRSIE